MPARCGTSHDVHGMDRKFLSMSAGEFARIGALGQDAESTFRKPTFFDHLLVNR
ncbi:uncharacterized protein FOMMEDRAFT_156782 [Fomitiporia mediterranea MF3/22]|uniref:uncharacterized protein n=1 Tax=Fomitiporia mediterranea (strain MF3/22) TaxID=694068 RepID=UPI0004409807|nr:uncharacterized protein FOMMEDRAFT_156782 [Fomitiporia mediterranea MF3/22]EJD03377.1 hypothetical protein FOMMEDRAFT_156782 [Fomitiporia mediterranea MF3/22]